MLQNIIEYIDKHKIIFTIITICLLIAVVYVYKIKQATVEGLDNVLPSEQTHISFDNYFVGKNILVNLETSIVVPVIDASGNTTQVSKPHHLVIMRKTECPNLVSQTDCFYNIATLVDTDTLNNIRPQYETLENQYVPTCIANKRAECLQNNSHLSQEALNKICNIDYSSRCHPNLRFISDFIIEKTDSQKYTLEGKTKDVIGSTYEQGTAMLLSRSLYSLYGENGRQLCFDGGRDENVEIEFVPTDQQNNIYKIRFTVTQPAKSVESVGTEMVHQQIMYIGKSDVSIDNTCNVLAKTFPRIALFNDINDQNVLNFKIIKRS